MSERIFARQLGGGLWQWRIATGDGRWLNDNYTTGDSEALAEARPNAASQITAILMGQQVVTTKQAFEDKMKKHLDKMLPYEMEENLVDSIDDLQLVMHIESPNRAAVAYTKQVVMEEALEDLNSAGVDVQLVYPDYLTLFRENRANCIVYDENLVIVRIGENIGFAVEEEMAALVLGGTEFPKSGTFNLVANSEEKLQRLQSWLPSYFFDDSASEAPEQVVDTSELSDVELLDQELDDDQEDLPDTQQEELPGKISVFFHVGGFWDWVDPAMPRHPLNLRSGAFARKLPIDRWWSYWRWPASMAAAAFGLAFLVSLGEYLQLKGERTDTVKEMRTIYQKAIPGGRGGDPLRALKAKVNSLGNTASAEPTNFLPLLSTVATTIGSKKVSMSSFRYNGDQGELMLNIEADNITELESLRSAVEGKGLQAELLRVVSQGEKHSARMKVTEGS